MTKRTRVIILLVCVACFFIIAPVLVFYSIGYRLDLKKMKITETGGIYVRTFPAADQIIIDYGIKEKPGIFSNSIFVQSLLPDEHSVLVKKSGYYDYSKTIPVLEEQVTKLENILLIKKNIQFNIVKDTAISPFISQDKFIIKNNNLYYSNALVNANLTAVQKSTPLLKKIVAFALQNNNVIWLGADGFIYKSDQTNLSSTPVKITLTAIKINKAGSYQIITDNNNIFVIANNELLSLNIKTNELSTFYSPAKGAIISPDGINIVYYDNNNIFISPISTEPLTQNKLYGSTKQIGSCVWLNDSNLIFTVGNKIIISEIDYRGKINSTTLPQTIAVSSTENITLENPQIFFDQQAGKLYILNNKILLVSEKITS